MSKTQINLTDINPAGGTNGQVVTVQSGALVYANPSGGGGTPIATNTTAGSINMLAGVAGAVPVDNGNSTMTNRRLTLDDISPAFDFSLATSAPGVIEVGGSVISPTFTLTPNQTLASANLNDTDGNPQVNFTSPFTSGTAPHTYTKTTINFTESWTVAATSIGAISKSHAVSTQYQARAYYGTATDTGTYNSAFITGLPSSELEAGFASTYNFGAASGTQFWFLALPATWGDPSTFTNIGTGFGVVFNKVANGVSVTNPQSLAISVNVWKTAFAQTLATNVRAS